MCPVTKFAVAVVVGEAVQAGPQRRRERLRVVVEVVLGAHQVRRRPRVAAVQQLLVGPLPGQREQRADVRGPPVDEVVRRHDAGHRPGLDRRLERHQVVLVQYPGAQCRGGQVAEVLVVVPEEVLDRGRGEQVPAPLIMSAVAGTGREAVSGESRGERRPEQGGQQRVLGVPLLVPAPARVAQQVHDRRPHVEPDQRARVVQRPVLQPGRPPDLPGQLGVPGGGEPDRLREHGGGQDLPRAPVIAPGRAVHALHAGAELREPKTRDRGRALVQHRDLLPGGQPAQQVVGALTERKGRITVANRFDRESPQSPESVLRSIAAANWHHHDACQTNCFRAIAQKSMMDLISP